MAVTLTNKTHRRTKSIAIHSTKHTREHPFLLNLVVTIFKQHIRTNTKCYDYHNRKGPLYFFQMSINGDTFQP